MRPMLLVTFALYSNWHFETVMVLYHHTPI